MATATTTGTKQVVRWGGYIALLTASIVCALFAAEILFRLFCPQPLLKENVRYAAADSGQYFELAPNQATTVQTLDGGYSFTTSSHGNRGGDPEPDAPDSSHTRILFCGDSFCFGIGLDDDETIPQRVEHHLPPLVDSNRTVEAFNIGQPGYSPAQTVSRLEEWLDDYHADLVVFLLFAGNDFVDGVPERLHSLRVDENGVIHVGHERSGNALHNLLHPVKRRLWSHSMVYSLVRRSLADYRRPNQFAYSLFQAPLNEVTFPDLVYVENALLRMQRVTAAHDTRLAIVALPALSQMDDGWWEAFEGDRSLDRFAPQEWLQSFCTGHGIPLYDISPVIRPLARDAYLPTDRHFTPDAADRVANTLASWIKKEDLLKDNTQ